MTLQWQDERATEILRKKTDKYEDQSTHIWNSTFKEELSDSDSEALMEELWNRQGFVIEIRVL